MMVGIVGAAFLCLFLSFANGSNDISKGIATLVGSGVSSLRAAVAWGAAWTVLGGLFAAFATQGLVATFSGKGFLARPTTGAGFLASVAVGAATWVLFASRAGLPVSTTHAIAGSLAGAALVAQGGSALHWGVLVQRIALPLLASPLVSGLLVFLLLPLVSRTMTPLSEYCVCIERFPLLVGGDALALTQRNTLAVMSRGEACAAPVVSARISAVDGLHWASSALTSFARGINDTPKIVALGVVAAATLNWSGFPFYLAVATAMGAGSLVGGYRVTETLARGVTRMTPVEGFAANAATALLTGIASFVALPVSTTHVSSGAIIGSGLRRGARSLHWPKVREMLLAWIVTLPVSAMLGAAACALLAGRS